MRCRLITSRGCRRSQGLGCSPIKVVRELGSDRQNGGTKTVMFSAKNWLISVKSIKIFNLYFMDNTEGSCSFYGT